MSKYFEIAIFDYEFVYKEAFWLFLIIPAIVFWYLYHEAGAFKNINYSTLQNFEKKKFNFIAFFRHLNLFLFITGLSLVILALARPHLPNDIEEYKKKNMEGIDIVMALDASGSMKAQDFKPDRLEAAKTVALDFISNRPSDRIGLVVFQAEAYTQAPLTNDHELLKAMFEQVQNINNAEIINDGTAIGLGLATAINRLRESDAKSKVIILLTDGVNNAGDVDPLTAAALAKENNICVYTIGVGQDGTAPYPVQTPFGTITQDMPVEIDEELLTQIATETGGKYYRAKNENELELIYKEIDQLEKSKVKVLEYKVNPPEKYYGLLALGIILILLYKTIHHTLFEKHPVMELNQHKYDLKNLVISVLTWELAFWLLYFSLFYYATDNVEAFQFENPDWLWMLLIVPLLVLGYFTVIQWKNKKLALLADARLLRYITFPVSNIKSFVKYFLFRNGIVFLILAMANPQYGQGKNKAVADGIEIMIALDISNSMRALDLDSKMDRLQVAKLSIERLLNNLHGDRVGLVIFAGDAFVQIPLTTDYRAAKLFLYSVRPEMMTNQGTDIGQAIDECMKSFDMENGVNKAIIVISDGEDHEGDPEQVAKGAFEHNVVVSTVGMGTSNETPIPDYVDGEIKGYKKDDEGNTVLTTLNAPMLQGIASAGGGAYVQAEGTYVNLEGLLETVREIEKTEMESVLYVDYEDQFQWFLGIGLLFLFIEFFLTEKRSGIVHKLQEYNG